MHLIFPSTFIDTHALHFTLSTFPYSTDVYETEVFSRVTNPDSLSSISVVILDGFEKYSVCETVLSSFTQDGSVITSGPLVSRFHAYLS